MTQRQAIVTEWLSDYEMAESEEMLIRCIINLMDKMTDDQRHIITSQFCSHCGRPDPGCQCWNDE